MALHTFDRAMIYRWMAGGLLWLLILTVVVISIRSINIASRAGRIAAGAVTAEQKQGRGYRNCEYHIRQGFLDITK